MRSFGLFITSLFFSFASVAQQTDSLPSKLDSLKQTDTAQVQLVEPEFYNERTKITPRVFGILLLSDLKQQTLSPLHLSKKGWLQTAAFTAGVFGVNFLDNPIQEWAATLRRNNPWTQRYSNTITNIGGAYEVAAFATIATYGFVFKNEKLRTTTYLATQAYITSTFWAGLFKTLSGRERPGKSDFGPVSFSPGFHGPFYTLTNGNSSFPSGHATLAFAAATVYAKEYSYIKAVPIIAYSVAGLISVSRITENRHWATDILSGAALGYLCGKQVVNNYHRYAKLQRTKHKVLNGTLSPTISYLNGTLAPGFVYRF